MMAFIKEGKEMKYEEVVQFMKHVKKHDILAQLEVDEILKLLQRLLDWHANKLQECIAYAGYDVRQSSKIIDIAYQLKLIANREIWKKGEALLTMTEEDKVSSKEKLIEFIHVDLIKEMKENESMITNKEK